MSLIEFISKINSISIILYLRVINNHHFERVCLEWIIFSVLGPIISQELRQEWIGCRTYSLDYYNLHLLARLYNLFKMLFRRIRPEDGPVLGLKVLGKMKLISILIKTCVIFSSLVILRKLDRDDLLRFRKVEKLCKKVIKFKADISFVA